MSQFTSVNARVKPLTMPLSTESKHAIKMQQQTKQYGAKRLISTFPNKQWSSGGLKN